MMHIRPFLKWAGGKQRCLPNILPHLPDASRLIEPFTGAGTIFLNTSYTHYILGELNQDLVNLYSMLRDHKVSFIEHCESFFTKKNNTKSRYYQLRTKFNLSQNDYDRAALFLYLNRHGFNGLCRYNKSGIYNVPYGDHGKNGPYFPKNELVKFSEKSQSVDFLCQDFKDTFALAKPGDVIYCDPPYSPTSTDVKSFSYHQRQFNKEEQVSLAILAHETSQKGITVIVSNHDTPFTRELYQSATIYSFPVQRFISCDGNKRQQVKELVAIYS